MKPTPYKDINEILEQLKVGFVNIFDKNLIGLYLTGSLSYGDFEPGRSDIDLFGVLRNPVSDVELEEVTKLHQKVEEENMKWVNRIESQYIPLEMLQYILPPKEPRPWWGFGTMHPKARYGNEWLINNYFLFHQGIPLVGPEFKTLMEPIGILDIQKASARDLFKEWQPKLNDPDFFQNSHYHSYIILNLCRILYTVKCAKVGSKKASAEWVKNEYPKWEELIEAAESWKYGMKMDYLHETKEFIKSVIDEVKVKHLED